MGRPVRQGVCADGSGSVIYTYVAVALISGACAATAAWQVQGWRHDSIEHARQVNQRATERLQRQNSNTAAVAHESDKVRIETEYRDVIKEVQRVVEKPVYRNVCFDPDGLSVIGDALARAYNDPGEPGNAVPKAATPK